MIRERALDRQPAKPAAGHVDTNFRTELAFGADGEDRLADRGRATSATATPMCGRQNQKTLKNHPARSSDHNDPDQSQIGKRFETAWTQSGSGLIQGVPPCAGRQ